MSTEQDDRVFLSFDEAVKLLPDGPLIHTFRNPGVGMLLGADWTREALLDAMRKAPAIEVTGKQAQAVRHGLCIESGGRLFIEAKAYQSEAA